MGKATERLDFTIEVDGKRYDCYRVVSGTRALMQRIHVAGIGSKPDGAQYGHKGHPVESMESIARLIAREIVRENRSADLE